MYLGSTNWSQMCLLLALPLFYFAPFSYIFIQVLSFKVGALVNLKSS